VGNDEGTVPDEFGEEPIVVSPVLGAIVEAVPLTIEDVGEDDGQGVQAPG
jgi:hypothetical protein